MKTPVIYDENLLALIDGNGKELVRRLKPKDAAFIVQAVNAHEEAMELLELVTIELHRKLVTGGMETNVAESLGLDELLIDIEGLLAKAGVRV